MTDAERRRRTAARVREGLEIDPDTAEVMWAYGAIMDPYGDDSDRPEVRRERTLVFFTRRPGGEWVCFDHLPDATRDTLSHKHVDELTIAQKFHEMSNISWTGVILSRCDRREILDLRCSHR
jgi:hypothetical protein